MELILSKEENSFAVSCEKPQMVPQNPTLEDRVRVDGLYSSNNISIGLSRIINILYLVVILFSSLSFMTMLLPTVQMTNDVLSSLQFVTNEDGKMHLDDESQKIVALLAGMGGMFVTIAQKYSTFAIANNQIRGTLPYFQLLLRGSVVLLILVDTFTDQFDTYLRPLIKLSGTFAAFGDESVISMILQHRFDLHSKYAPLFSSFLLLLPFFRFGFADVTQNMFLWLAISNVSTFAWFLVVKMQSNIDKCRLDVLIKKRNKEYLNKGMTVKFYKHCDDICAVERKYE